MQHQNSKNNEDMKLGMITTGTVVLVDEERKKVYIGIQGAKKEGEVPIEEFQTIPKKNEEILVYAIMKEDNTVFVSKKKADEIESYKELEDCYKNEKPILGKVLNFKEKSNVYEVSVLNGVFVCIVSKYLMSQNKNKDVRNYIGKEYYFIIKKLQEQTKKTRRSVVLSRVHYLEKIGKENKEKFLNEKKVGDIVEGTVSSFVNFGTFIDLGGFDGLLHVTNMSCGHTPKPKNLLKKGDKINVKIIEISEDKEKISLSLKEATPNPWDTFLDKYKLDDIIEGKITKILDFGLFVEMEPGIEGLVYINDISWSRKIIKPSELYKVGAKVKAQILGFDLDNYKVSLSIKQTQKNPWDDLLDKYTVGSSYTKKVVKVIKNGIFVEMENGLDCFIHIDDFSWTYDYQNASEAYKEGDEVTFAITSIYKEDKKMKLSIKQLEENPFRIFKKYQKERLIAETEVKEVKDNGLVVEFFKMNGFIPMSEIAFSKEESSAKLQEFKVGDKAPCIIIKINKVKNEFIGSINLVKNREAQMQMKEYISDKGDEKAKLFDIIKNEENNDKEV